mgnify:CR=1 FL=1
MKDAPAKIVTLAFYVAALVSLFVTWPPLLENILQIGTLILPSLMPVVLWAAFNRPFIEDLLPSRDGIAPIQPQAGVPHEPRQS